MTFTFAPRQGLVIVPAELTGPSGIAVLRLALDTGSTPPSAGVDGLLGLDFLRGLTLTIDFRTGGITLA